MRKWLALWLMLTAATCARAALSVTGTDSYASNNNDSSITLNLPASIATGDLLLAQINFESFFSFVFPPPGWTLLRHNSSGFDQQLIYYHLVGAGDTPNAATTWSFFLFSVRTAGTLIGIRSSTGTVTQGANAGSGGFGSTLTAGSVNATAAGLLLRFYGIESGNAAFTLPAGVSPIALAASTSASNGSSVVVGSRNISAAGATVSDQATASHTGWWVAQSLFLIDNQPSQLHHFEFTHDGQGLTCEPEDITIRACANNDCSTLVSTAVSVTLNPTNGWVSGNTHTFTGSTVLQLRQTTADTAAISVASSSPSASSGTVCNGVDANTCNLPFADAGFAFDVPNLLANKPSGPVRLRAVRNSGDLNNSCVALFQNTTQAVNFWSTYTAPATGTRAVELRAGSGTGAFTSISGNSATPTALNLSFDNSGETLFEARYQDAGLMALNARYTGTGTYAGLILNGTDAFVSTPARFCVRGARATTPPYSYATCTSNFTACPVIATVGSPFVLDITAAAWEADSDSDFCSGNGTTPNYAQNSLALSSQFGLNAVQFGAAGTASNGIVAPATVNISGGNVTQTNVTESEVGAFNFIVTPPANAYFGVTVPSGTSSIIGRFIPHHFSIASGSALINRATTCAVPPAFTYLSETLNLAYQVNALNASNVITQNYQGIFASLSAFAQMNTAAIAGSPRTALAVTSAGAFSASWVDGQGAITSPVMVAKTATPVGPYTGTAFGVAPTDADGVATTGFNLDTQAPADSTNDRVQIGTTTELRYGRLRLDSVSGPADTPLAVPMTAEYWNNNGFIANPLDTNCAQPALNGTSVTATAYRGELNSGETTASGSGNIVGGQAPTALRWSAPGIGNEGDVDYIFPTNAWPWLQFDWNGDGTLDVTAPATASFGTYRGSDRVIYWQET